MENFIDALNSSQGIITTIGSLVAIFAFFGIKFKDRIFEINSFNYKNRKRFFVGISKPSYGIIRIITIVVSGIFAFSFQRIISFNSGILIIFILLSEIICINFFNQVKISLIKMKKISKRRIWNFIDKEVYVLIYFLSEFITFTLVFIFIKINFLNESILSTFNNLKNIETIKSFALLGIIFFVMILCDFSFRIFLSSNFENKYSYAVILRDKTTCYCVEDIYENKNYYFLTNLKFENEENYETDNNFTTEFKNKEIIQIEKELVFKIECNIKTLNRIDVKK